MSGKVGYRYYRIKSDSASAIYKTRDGMDHLKLFHIEKDLGPLYGENRIPFDCLSEEEKEILTDYDHICTWSKILERDEDIFEQDVTEITKEEASLLKKQADLLDASVRKRNKRMKLDKHKRKIKNHLDRGVSISSIARTFDVSQGTVRRYINSNPKYFGKGNVK